MSFLDGIQKDGPGCIKESSTATASLDDCLACSGCVSAEELGVLARDPSSAIDREAKTSFVISPQSKASIFDMYRSERISYRMFEKGLCVFLRNVFNVDQVIDTSYVRSKIYEEVYKEYLATKHLIVSACPGVVTYVERTAPHLLGYLSRVKSPQQMAYSLVSRHKAVSVMPCQDKRLENGRDLAMFDAILTTKEFHSILCSLSFGEFISEFDDACEMETHEMTQWNIGTSTGGYTEFVIGKECLSRLSDVREGVREHVVASGDVLCQITGLENSINYFNTSKTSGPKYKMAEVFLCRGGCIAGPGQERTGKTGADSYDQCGKEKYEMVYSVFGEEELIKKAMEQRRMFAAVDVKRKTFKVDW
ncbi:putative Fe-only hydrogenase [Ordospora pajunii]|uniref:putative Fe-only hydrogenase n=1 Tax=Ordospora pajunii TaxID=3039483 RepID=UPI0029529213|nr:putative Fe-only hydrogenase [Ordospora pajunii]KAH9412258.1 putative Fe-only hydrogenase [Ordospora pajunii]